MYDVCANFSDTGRATGQKHDKQNGATGGAVYSACLKVDSIVRSCVPSVSQARRDRRREEEGKGRRIMRRTLLRA